nr:MAG TPA_asm: hypothetical protein [Caudoviricetes sp.]
MFIFSRIKEKVSIIRKIPLLKKISTVFCSSLIYTTLENGSAWDYSNMILGITLI